MEHLDSLGFIGLAALIAGAALPAMRRKPADPLSKYSPHILGLLGGYAALYRLGQASKEQVATELSSMPSAKRALEAWLDMSEKDRLLLGRRQLALQASPEYRRAQATTRKANDRPRVELFRDEGGALIEVPLGKPLGRFRIASLPD